MNILSPYTKAILSIVAAAFAVLVTALTDNRISAVEAVNIAIAVITAVGVYLVPNLEKGAARYLKLVVALVGAALSALVAFVGNGFAAVTPAEWITVALAALAAVGVGIVPNVGPGKHAAPENGSGVLTV